VGWCFLCLLHLSPHVGPRFDCPPSLYWIHTFGSHVWITRLVFKSIHCPYIHLKIMRYYIKINIVLLFFCAFFTVLHSLDSLLYKARITYKYSGSYLPVREISRHNTIVQYGTFYPSYGPTEDDSFLISLSLFIYFSVCTVKHDHDEVYFISFSV
jgi:hypothetical protein